MYTRPNITGEWLSLPNKEGEWWRKHNDKINKCTIKFLIQDGISDINYYAKYFIKNEIKPYKISRTPIENVYWQEIR